MFEVIRFSAIDPATHRQKHKSFSTKRYTREQIEKLGKEWVEEVRAGKHSPPVKNKGNMAVSTSNIDESYTSEEEENPGHHVQLFRSQSIDSLNTPDDKFGMSFLLLGQTRSGKSTLMVHLWETYFKGHICILHTNSHQSEIYKPLAKGCACCPFFSPELISETSKINGATKNYYKFLHIIDDVVDKKNNKELIKLLTIGRNHRLSTIITGQELSIFNSIGRSNINFVCLFKLGSDFAIEKVIKQYLRSSFPSDMGLNDMIKVYKHITRNHGFFVIDNLNDKVFVSRLNDV
jgi:hypothetical protein